MTTLTLQAPLHHTGSQHHRQHQPLAQLHHLQVPDTLRHLASDPHSWNGGPVNFPLKQQKKHVRLRHHLLRYFNAQHQ